MSPEHADSPLAQAQQKVAQLEHALNTLFASLPEPLCVFSLDGKCIDVLGCSAHIENSRFGKFKGQHLDQLFAPEVAKLFKANMTRAAFQRETIVFDYPMATSEQKAWFQGRMTPIAAADGDIEHVSLLTINISEKKYLEQDLQKHLQLQAATDPLTKIMNRPAFLSHFNEHFEQFQLSRSPFSLLLLDLDHFRKINDRWGHDIGDKVIVHMVALLSDQLRSSDTLARLEGEGFGVLLPGTDAAKALGIAERHRALIAAASCPHDASVIDYTCSIGLSSVDPSDRSAQDLMKRAETALHHAKQSGRNKVCYY